MEAIAQTAELKPDYQREGITLFHADCLDILPHLTGIDAVITDPPYGVNLTECRTKHTRTTAEYESTDDSECAVLRVVSNALGIILPRCRNAVVTPGIRLLQKYPRAADIGAVFYPNGAGIGPWGFICYHPVLYYGRCPYLSASRGSRPNGVSATHWNRRSHTEHPCEKPLRMMEWLVVRGSLEKETVLDPFMGSGTTGIACIRTGRKFIGIEKERKYFEIARDRIDRELNQGVLAL